MEQPEKFLNLRETAARLALKPRTLRGMIEDKVLQSGKHYFRPTGRGRGKLIFDWGAICETLKDIPQPPA